tara:strand:+ start:453 stop:845 length:393 start_codon:yes stop_codon:yes gene_type:complete
MDGLFDIKHGITIRGKEYGFVGIGNDEIDQRVDEMLNFVELYKGSAGGTFGEDMEVCVDFPHETLTIEKFTKFEKSFRERYPTFDGHVYLHDINHFTSTESKYLDAFVDGDEFDDPDADMNTGDEWKNIE